MIPNDSLALQTTSTQKRDFLVVIIIIAIVGSFYFATIRDGHRWGGDFAMYIQHAKNIAEGIDYNDTGYLYNPFTPFLGPQTYPPIFPLLLSPVYKWFGLNLSAMKIEVILIFLLSLFMIFLAFRNELPYQYVVAMIAIIGFNPYFWDFKDYVLSDLPFLFFVYLSLFSIHQQGKLNKAQKYQIPYAIVVGFFLYLSYGTRSLGIVLIPCLFIHEIIRAKKITQFTIIVTLVFVFSVATQTALLQGISYTDHISVKPGGTSIIYPQGAFHAFSSYGLALSILWDNGYSKAFRGIVFLILCALASIGYLARIKDRITIFEIFLAIYILTVIILLASRDLRLLIPVIPLYLYYVFVGITQGSLFRRHEVQRSIFFVLIAAISVSYAGKYTKVDYRGIDIGIAKKETVEMFEYVKKRTNKSDVFIFQKPRVLSLFTGRIASGYHWGDEHLWKYIQQINASYLIVTRHNVGGLWPIDDQVYLRGFVEKYKETFREIYANEDFKVYRIRSTITKEQIAGRQQTEKITCGPCFGFSSLYHPRGLLTKTI